MYSISMTTRLGLAALLGAIAIVVIADGKDQTPITKQCKGENCANIGQVISKKIPKSMQQSIRPGDGQTILKPGGFVGLAQGDSATLYETATANTKVLIKRSVDKPVGKKPAQRAVKSSSWRFPEKPPKRLVNNPPQRLVESPQRSRREDDPSSWRVGFN